MIVFILAACVVAFLAFSAAGAVTVIAISEDETLPAVAFALVAVAILVVAVGMTYHGSRISNGEVVCTEVTP